MNAFYNDECIVPFDKVVTVDINDSSFTVNLIASNTFCEIFTDFEQLEAYKKWLSEPRNYHV